MIIRHRVLWASSQETFLQEEAWSLTASQPWILAEAGDMLIAEQSMEWDVMDYILRRAMYGKQEECFSHPIHGKLNHA